MLRNIKDFSTLSTVYPVVTVEPQTAAAKATPWTTGAWRKSREVRNWIMSGHVHVATIPTTHDGDWSRANASLISAAPDLYEALVRLKKQAAVDLRRLGLAPDEIAQELQEADAALAKARGD